MGVLLKRGELDSFLRGLSGELVAPVKRDVTRFETITSFDQISFEKNPVFPIKKYFLPKKESVFNIKNNKTSFSKNFPEITIFGARLCDLNSIIILDKIFLDENPDPIYEARRSSMTLIGFNCASPPSEFCFCESMDLKSAYDLLFHPLDNDTFYIDIGSKKGAALVKHLPDFNFQVPLPKTDKKLKIFDINPFYDKKYWESDAKKCVSCQRCTILCPTCFCFDLHDDMNLDLKSGSRNRLIDSCHSEDFTLVADGSIFRPERLQRYRHRVFHKLQYFKEKFDLPMCVGCGRCIEFCHSKIDFVEMVNNLVKE